MTTDDQLLRVERELLRIFGAVGPEKEPNLMILPLPTPEIALRFLATVPSGTTYEQAARLLTEFLAAEDSKELRMRFRW